MAGSGGPPHSWSTTNASADAGAFITGYFAAGDFATGVFAVGEFVAGVFAAGMFSVGFGMSARASTCPGCPLLLPEREGPTHPYLGSSPACWHLYGEVLAREYSEPAYFGVHQLTVDTYAVQHPGVAERRSIQSVALHLITLSLMLERGADRGVGPKLHKRLAKRGGFHWLEPPERNGQITVADVHQAANATEHLHAVEAWAHDVWEAWAAHHSTVRRWSEEGLRAS